jgi:hypothetical protein
MVGLTAMATARALSVVTAVTGTGIKLGLSDLSILMSMIANMTDRSFIVIVKIGGAVWWSDRRIDEEPIFAVQLMEAGIRLRMRWPSSSNGPVLDLE